MHGAGLCSFFDFDLQIPRSSLIITGLFADFFAIVQSGDAARSAATVLVRVLISLAIAL
jgi:hypothetical protein